MAFFAGVQQGRNPEFGLENVSSMTLSVGGCPDGQL